MDFDKLVDWLFERSDRHPQIGFAGADKRAWAWVPGAAPMNPDRVHRAIKNAPLRGCTQIAYDNIQAPMGNQVCEMCWFGLDIDADDNPGTDLIEVANRTIASMVRTSCSGKGIHVIYRLDKPIVCTHETSGKLVKQIALKYKDRFENAGVRVCKADKRMFWLTGGLNSLIKYHDKFFVHPKITSIEKISAPVKYSNSLNLTPIIRGWCSRLGLSADKKSIPVYIGDMVSLLNGFGEKVVTRSQCRGNGHVNGYIDLTPTSISLWSYADGHTIWSFTDVEALINGN